MSANVGSVVCLCLAFAFLVLCRAPGWMSEAPLNVDESALLAGAITANHRGMLPWRDFDLATTGPVTVWLLSAITAALGPLTFSAAHFVAAILWATTTILVIATMRVTCGRPGALVAFAISIGLSLLSWRREYLHFTTELVPSLLLAAAALLIVVCGGDCSSRRSCWLLPFIGCFCSLAALAKLQALPVSLFLFTAAVVTVERPAWKKCAAAGLLVFAGAALPIALLSAWLLSEGQLPVAVKSYVLTAASYGTAEAYGIASLSDRFRSLCYGWYALRPFFETLPIALLGLCWLGWRPWKLERSKLCLVVLFFGWFAAALVIVLVPSTRAEHHGVFLVAPTIALLTYLICECLELTSCHRGNNGRRFQSYLPRGSLFLLLGLAVWTWSAYPRMLQNINEARNLGWWGGNEWPSKEMRTVADLIQKTTPPGTAFAVWGWAPELFVLTQRPSATRHVIGHFLIEKNAQQVFHRTSFMADLLEKRPHLIVDAVAPGFCLLHTWRNDYEQRRADSFPELAVFLKENYRILTRTEVGACRDMAVIYIRN